jgi:hypothetical protein
VLSEKFRDFFLHLTKTPVAEIALKFRRDFRLQRVQRVSLRGVNGSLVLGSIL